MSNETDVGIAYRVGLGLVSPRAWPLTDQLRAYLQDQVNDAAASTLVIRRVLDVDYTSEALPFGLVTLTAPSGDVSVEGSGARAAQLTYPGQVAVETFSLDATLVQMGQEEPSRLPVSELVGAARKLARWENEVVVRSLAAQAWDPADGLPPIESLRANGYVGILADFRPLAPPSAETSASGVQAIAAEEPIRSYAVPVRGSNCPSVTLEPGPQNMRVEVGQNYTLSWLACDGSQHTFAISVSVATIVHDSRAIRGYQPELETATQSPAS